MTIVSICWLKLQTFLEYCLHWLRRRQLSSCGFGFPIEARASSLSKTPRPALGTTHPPPWVKQPGDAADTLTHLHLQSQLTTRGAILTFPINLQGALLI